MNPTERFPLPGSAISAFIYLLILSSTFLGTFTAPRGSFLERRRDLWSYLVVVIGGSKSSLFGDVPSTRPPIISSLADCSLETICNFHFLRFFFILTLVTEAMLLNL